MNCTDSICGKTPLIEACERGHEEIIRILLEAGADPRRTHSGWSASAIVAAVEEGHFSIVEMLLNHDNGQIEMEDRNGNTPLLAAIFNQQQFDIVHLLLDRGASALATNKDGETPLIIACSGYLDLEIMRRLLAAGVPVDARDCMQRTALHYSAGRARIDAVRELIVEHNANIFAVDHNGKTPFDSIRLNDRSAGETYAFLLECYGNKLTQQCGRLALHAILEAVEYSFAWDEEFHESHPPLNPMRLRLPLGTLELDHFRSLLHSLDIESIRTRDDSGKLPIHIACQANAPVEVLSMLVEMDPTTLQIADHTGALPIHCLCGSGTPAEYGSVRYLVEQGGVDMLSLVAEIDPATLQITDRRGALPIHSLCGSGTPAEYGSVQYLVEQGGVGTLAARNRDGALPLHVLCGSTYPPLRTVQYMIQSFPESVATQTNYGQYPFTFAARDTSEASLSVVYELVRANYKSC